MLRQWRKNEEFWHGFQYLFWSDRDNSWRSPADIGWEDDEDIQEQLGSFSDKVIDIFKAHGESIISALAAQLPSLRFLPDDAENIDDLLTARTYSKIADLVQRHNRAKMLFFRALFFLYLNGITASYRYKDSDFKYGSYEVPVITSEDVERTEYTCETCGYQADQDWTLTGEACPQCQSIDPPEVAVATEQVPKQTGTESHPKSRAKIDIFGPIHFKVSYYARSQDECTYFILYGDQGKDLVKFTYPDFADEIEDETMENLDRFSRSGYNAVSDPIVQQRHLVTVRKAWLRPAAFYRECEKSRRDRLLKKFPSGCRVTLIGKNYLFIDSRDENLDDRWQIGQAGLSTFIHADPICRPLVQIQEMRNQLVNLIIETISHGIPSEFADPEVVNFDIYGRFEAVPGYIYKAKPRKLGEALGNSFYTSNRASLSAEVALFLKQLDQDAQFAIGSFPSIYGGASEGKSRTFAEYSMSRQMALQRLSIVWNFVVEWWSKTLEGAVKLYTECVVEDEKFVKFDNGNYINVWIKQAEMAGKVGGVESEASESFPVSLGAIKELLLKLMEMQIPAIDTVLYNPVNSRLIQDALALTDLKVPGEAQRVKQVGELTLLLQSSPISPVQSTVPIDIEVDDHKVHIAAIDEYLVDSVGLEEKRVNPDGYANCKAHRAEHVAAISVLTAQTGEQPAGVAPASNQGPTEGE